MVERGEGEFIFFVFFSCFFKGEGGGGKGGGVL